MGFLLNRKLKAANPYASNPSTAERDKAARRQAKTDRKTAGRGARHRAELDRGNGARWPW
jgi:hypothetical protein